ncbi:MAG TPA: hypothetical protein VN255_09935, partial [Mycobacterium sp.]|nr:hypothetical protein [Mycobacterium sp.]
TVLWRIHAVAGLLMMPQTVTVTFMLVWLMNDHGWSIAVAGAWVTLSQLLGALGRIAVAAGRTASGQGCDRCASSLSPPPRPCSCSPSPII